MGSGEVENFVECVRHRAGVGIGGHEIRHVFPPATADLCVGDGGPALFALNIGVGEKLVRLGMQKDGVVFHVLGAKGSRALLSDGLMTSRVPVLESAVCGYDEIKGAAG